MAKDDVEQPMQVELVDEQGSFARADMWWPPDVDDEIVIEKKTYVCMHRTFDYDANVVRCKVNLKT